MESTQDFAWHCAVFHAAGQLRGCTPEPGVRTWVLALSFADCMALGQFHNSLYLSLLQENGHYFIIRTEKATNCWPLRTHRFVLSRLRERMHTANTHKALATFIMSWNWSRMLLACLGEKWRPNLEASHKPIRKAVFWLFVPFFFFFFGSGLPAEVVNQTD